MKKNRLSAVFLKILDIFSFNNLAKIKEIVIIQLYSVTELHSTYHFISK